MYRTTHRLVGSTLIVFCCLASRLDAQAVISLQSNCPGNSCAMSIGAPVPEGQAGGNPIKPGPASGSTDFNPVGHPWTFSFQTASPQNWAYSQDGYEYNASFGEGGTMQVTGPAGTFTGTITSASAEGEELPSYAYNLSANFSGNWNDGTPASGQVNLNYTDDFVVEFTSTLTISPVPAPSRSGRAPHRPQS